jgi:6-pyruvoyl-tetrahydropterin synthase
MNKLFVQNLTVIDFSYFDASRGILGESWIVDIVLEGELDEQGMVFDFGHVKKRIKEIIDEELDHRFVLSTQLKSLQVETTQRKVRLSWDSQFGHFEHESPRDAIVLLEAKTINPKTVAKYLEGRIKPALPENVKSVSLTLYEEQIDGAYYHYSHGLKKHLGNCQRIVHGHRSRIEIYENHQRDSDLEDYWSACFRNIYLGTREDVKSVEDIDGKSHTTFAYTAQQGRFKLTLPTKRVYVIDSDSTVELIAAHIADECARKNPNNHYLVKAFEGVGKGAIAERSSNTKSKNK